MPKLHSGGQIFNHSSLYTKFLMPKLHSRGQIFNFNRSHQLSTKLSFLPALRLRSLIVVIWQSDSSVYYLFPFKVKFLYISN